jgi:hypothetical protein
MALETLQGLKEINGVNVDDESSAHVGTNCYIGINHDNNTIAFQIQNGPIKEAGKNGCQITELIAVAHRMISELNKKFPCRENAMTITKLDEALMWQEKRTKDREKRNVEGTSKA